MSKIAVFVDVQNIYYTSRDTFGRAFNYRYFWQQLSQQGSIEHAFAYAIDRGDDKQQKFQQALKHIGFEVKLKPFIQRSDGSAKGDWDVGITIDVLEYAEQVDKVVLLSGDGDFDRLLSAVQQRFGVKCDVYGVRALTAKSLIDACNTFVAIDERYLL